MADLYNQQISDRLLWNSASNRRQRFHYELEAFLKQGNNNWQLAIASISQTVEGKKYCNELLDNLFDSFEGKDYLEANRNIFNKKLIEAIKEDLPNWEKMHKFNGTFNQKLIFMTRYALKYERPEFMYRRVALFTHLMGPESIRFTVETYYRNLVIQNISPSGQILRHMGTNHSTESCAVIREPAAVSDAGDGNNNNNEQQQRIFMSMLIKCMVSSVGVGLEFKHVKNITNYTFLADSMSHPNRSNVFNFNQSIGHVLVLEILKETNTLGDAPLKHLFTIGMLDDFWYAVKNNAEWGMYDTQTEICTSLIYRQLSFKEKFARTMPARKLLDLICNKILATGKPSIVFLDNMNRFCQLRTWNADVRQEQHQSNYSVGGSNLCTEISLPMADRECATCCVGTVNVKNIFKELSELNTYMKKIAMQTSILVDILNVSHFTSSFRYSRQYRPLAIGLLGFCDTFCQGHPDSKTVIDRLTMTMEALYLSAINRSCDWSEIYGPFHHFDQSSWAQGLSQVELRQKSWKFENPLSVLDRVRKTGMFNLTLTGQPPTASTALLNNCSAGIEMPVTDAKNRTMAIKLYKFSSKMCYGSVLNAFNNSEFAIPMVIAQSRYLDQSASHNMYIRKQETDQLADRLWVLWKSGVKTGNYYARTEQDCF